MIEKNNFKWFDQNETEAICKKILKNQKQKWIGISDADQIIAKINAFKSFSWCFGLEIKIERIKIIKKIEIQINLAI